MQDLFKNAPTVGSHDANQIIEALQARVYYLEQQLTATKAQAQPIEPPPKKIRWGRIRKFFNTFVKPILDFIPKVINAVANYKLAVAKIV